MVAYLEPDEDFSIAYEITTNTYRIGRNPSNDLPIPDRSVSRQHAEIRRQGGHFTITDLDSMNGVFVNNQQQKHSLLTDNDSIDVGNVTFRFKLETDRQLESTSNTGESESLRDSHFDILLDDIRESKNKF